MDKNQCSQNFEFQQIRFCQVFIQIPWGIIKWLIHFTETLSVLVWILVNHSKKNSDTKLLVQLSPVTLHSLLCWAHCSQSMSDCIFDHYFQNSWHLGILFCLAQKTQTCKWRAFSLAEILNLMQYRKIPIFLNETVSSASVKCIDVMFCNLLCLTTLQNNPLADLLGVNHSYFISLKHFSCAMLGNKFYSEISAGLPISKWFYSVWTQIHKFFFDVFALKGRVTTVLKDFYCVFTSKCLMLLSKSWVCNCYQTAPYSQR